MVAYNFNTAFVNLIIEGKKKQTIRAHRKRHARPGEPIQLYRGMRTKKCRKLIDPDPVCVSVKNIEINVRPGFECLWRFPEEHDTDQPVSDQFAYDDGFLNAKHFAQFWRRTHGVGVFEGVLIKWEASDDG